MTTAGQQTQTDGTSDFNAMAFLVEQMLAKASFSTLVKVIACSNNGGVTPVGTVDVQILVNQVDGTGNAVPHVTVHGLPYVRIQGGANGVIIDPEAGDIGVAVFAHSDISSVKANKGEANPGSARRNSVADGMYIGGALNRVPTQYVQFNDGSGITVTSPVAVTVNAPTATINAPTTVVNSTNTTVNASAAATVSAANVVLNASAQVAINSPSVTIN